MKLKKILIKVSIFIVGIIVMDLALSQVAKRTVHQWRNAFLEKEARILTKPYHHGLKPYQEFEHKFGELRTPFYTNSLGFRDASTREVPLKSYGRRILIIGDSITEGVGVPYEQTFAGLIAKQLEKSGTEVLNAGVQTYAHQIYYTKIVHYMETLKLQVSDVFVFGDIGDIANDADQYKIDENGNVVRRNPNCRYGIGCRYRPMKRFKFWLADNSIIYRTYRVVKDSRRETRTREAQSPYEVATGVPSGGWTLGGDEYEAYGKRGLEVAGRAMTRLADFLSRRNVGMTVVVYPWPLQIAKRDLDSLQVRFWRDWAAKTGAKFINLFPSFINGRDPKEVYEAYFIPYDIHFNERGHELMASEFLAQFE